jgi:uncharacterized membrane protein HdeD (DUF308 family)
MLSKILSRYWWMTLLRGVLWILFGIVVFTNPVISVVSLTLTFGAFALADGIGHIVTALGGHKENDDRWVLFLVGLCGLGVGVLTFITPEITALVLLFYIAMWAIATGLLEIVAAIRLRKEIEGEFWLAASGLISLAFGVFLIARPGPGVLSVLWLLGGFAVAYGVTLVLLALRVHKLVSHVTAHAKV